MVHAADVQDRDGGALLMSTMFGLYPFLIKLYADGGYQGAQFQQGLKRVCRQINVEIVKRSYPSGEHHAAGGRIGALWLRGLFNQSCSCGVASSG